MSPAEPEASLAQLTALSGVRRALLVRSDGLLIVQHSVQYGARPSAQAAEEEVQGTLIRAAAMTATALSLNKRLVGALGGGVLTETRITGTEGNVLLYAVGPRSVLVLITERETDTARLARNVKEALAAITAALSSSQP